MEKLAAVLLTPKVKWIKENPGLSCSKTHCSHCKHRDYSPQNNLKTVL